MLGTANASIILPDQEEPLKVALLGIEPGEPGEPLVVKGRHLGTKLAQDVILDRTTILRSGLDVGNTLTLRVTQGYQDEFFRLRVVGISDGQQYALQPVIFTPLFTWERIRPKSDA